MAFPVLEPDQYSDKGEPIHGASVAINRTLTNLHHWAQEDTTPRFSLVLINYFTLVRNCYDPAISTTRANIAREIDTLVSYLDAYMRHSGGRNPRKLPIFIYVPTYKKLPLMVRREPNTELKRVLTTAASLESKLTDIIKTCRYSEFCQVAGVSVGSNKIYPHEDLGKELLRLAKEKGFGYRYPDPYLCISHIQLDWHLIKTIPNMLLCESFTGKTLTENMFGDKLTGLKDKKVPFSSELHRVFGDSTLIEPLVRRKKKKDMLTAAEKWAITPSAKILSQMSEISGEPISVIKTPQF